MRDPRPIPAAVLAVAPQLPADRRRAAPQLLGNVAHGLARRPTQRDLLPLREAQIPALQIASPPLPRAVLVLRDVLGCSAKETARLLETTVASVNSALQRARAGLRASLPEDREAWQHAAEATAAERELLARYVECSERVDVEGLAALMLEDVRFSMPPTPGVWTGRSTVVQGWIDGGFGSEAFGSMRCVLTRANGQPAVAGYVRKPGDAAYERLAIDVLRVQDGVVTEIVTFGRVVFEHFDLAATLSAADGTK